LLSNIYSDAKRHVETRKDPIPQCLVTHLVIQKISVFSRRTFQEIRECRVWLLSRLRSTAQDCSTTSRSVKGKFTSFIRWRSPVTER